VEAIKVLLVFFMAGYFASKWEWLRDLREKRLLPPGFALGSICPGSATHCR